MILRPCDEPSTLRDEQGVAWRVGEQGLREPGDALLPRVPGVLSYWFAWSAYHPRSEVVGAGPEPAPPPTGAPAPPLGHAAP
ncbi:MAG: hypothetical protein QNK04_07730 [Myxococcota bacterium]|nr:hypothetical protein [Myxococcota bacterium]